MQELTDAEKWEAAVVSSGAEFENFLRTNNGRLVGNVDWHYKLEDYPFPDFDTDTWTMAEVEDYIDAVFNLENDFEQVRFRYDKYLDVWYVYHTYLVSGDGYGGAPGGSQTCAGRCCFLICVLVCPSLHFLVHCVKLLVTETLPFLLQLICSDVCTRSMRG